MSKLFSARELAEQALQKIGVFSINDGAADPVELDRALIALDLELGFLAGTTRQFILVPSALTVALTAQQASYNLISTLGTSAPTNGIQFPVSAMYDKDSDGLNMVPLEIVNLEKWEAIDDPEREGVPEMIFLDRQTSPTMYVHPVPAEGTSGNSIRLTVQTYGDLIAGTKGNQIPELRAAWQKWAVYATAASVGDGTVRRLPQNEITDLRTEAARAKAMLEGFENRSHETTVPQVAYWDPIDGL